MHDLGLSLLKLHALVYNDVWQTVVAGVARAYSEPADLPGNIMLKKELRELQ